MPSLVPKPDVEMRLAAKIRVIYGDTDRMGIVYHGTYLRYLEHARVEFMRDLGELYVAMERDGYGLPVTDIQVSYLAPARYDDLVSVYVGVSRLGLARLNFAYKLVVEPADRFVGKGESPLVEPSILMYAETRHACVSLEETRVCRLPTALHDRIAAFLGQDD